MPAFDLIAESVERDCIATTDHTEALADELEMLCDDCVLNGGVAEFWGETPDGDEWRVHLRVRPALGDGEDE